MIFYWNSSWRMTISSTPPSLTCERIDSSNGKATEGPPDCGPTEGVDCRPTMTVDPTFIATVDPPFFNVYLCGALGQTTIDLSLSDSGSIDPSVEAVGEVPAPAPVPATGVKIGDTITIDTSCEDLSDTVPLPPSDPASSDPTTSLPPSQ